MNELEQLKKENDELIVKLASIVDSKSCVTCNNSGVYDYDDGFGGVGSNPCHCTNNPYSTYSIVNSTQVQSLADIKADAEAKGAEKFSNGLAGNISALIKEAENDANKDLLFSLMFMHRMIEEYTSKLRNAP